MNGKNWDPTKGERLRPAWVAIINHAMEHEWIPRDELVRIGHDASPDLLPVSVRNMISSATRYGWFEAKPMPGRKETYFSRKQVRLTEAGAKRWAALYMSEDVEELTYE